MSLYNMLHGVNQNSKLLLKIIGLDEDKGVKFPEEWDCYEQGITEVGQKYIDECKEKKQYPTGRFRDISLNEDGTKIVLYTRNGGGNRESYEYVFEILESHPNYICDYDDDFDCTYAYIEFSVPDEWKDSCKTLATGEFKTIKQKLDEAMKEIEGMTMEQFESDPRFSELAKTMKQISNFMEEA